MAQVFQFYHDQLPDDAWRDFYIKAAEAIRAREPYLYYRKVLSQSPTDYYHVLSYVYNDHPELFYFNYYGCKYKISSSMVLVQLCYIETEDSMQRKNREVNQAVNRILAECFPDGIEAASEIRREKKLFDWLTKNVTYDHKSLEESSTRMDILGDAWTVYGALVLKNAVCQGIACAFKMLCDQVNLPSIVVLGNAGGRHAWNIVRIEGRFYQVDCTWLLKNGLDLNIPFARYKYLNITDALISETHKADVSFLPKCNSLHYNPYKLKGYCCENPADLYPLARQHAANGEDRFALLCTYGHPTDNELKHLAHWLASQCGGTVYYYSDSTRHYLGFVIERSR